MCDRSHLKQETTMTDLTYDELPEWLAGRKEAGLKIDIETCKLGCWYAYDLDPYGVLELSEEERQVGSNRFVCSPESGGWVWEGDLPPDKAKAMYDRLGREPEPDDLLF